MNQLSTWLDSADQSFTSGTSTFVDRNMSVSRSSKDRTTKPSMIGGLEYFGSVNNGSNNNLLIVVPLVGNSHLFRRCDLQWLGEACF